MVTPEERQPAPHACLIVGTPVGHSLSPVLHRAAYVDLGLDGWTYSRLELTEDAFVGTVTRLHRDGLDGLPLGGLSVTMPLKRLAAATFPPSPEVARIGVANTLVPEDADGRAVLRAYNTDVDGIVGALAEAGVHEVPGYAVVVGAGGTATSALVALDRLGATDVRVVSRRGLGRPGVTEVPWAEGPDHLVGADLVVSTVPAGVADPFADLPWRPDAVVLDAAYSGGSRLLAGVAARGGTPVRGESMLLHQAVRQVRLMTGLDPSVEAMRAALPGGGRPS